MLLKRIFLIAFLLCFVLILKSQDVRNGKWGMSKKQIKSLEKGRLTKEEKDKLYYDITVDGDSFFLLYGFNNDSLNQATLLYEESHFNSQLYYEKFLQISKKLEKKYGSLIDNTKWIDDLYEDKPNEYGLAASIGHVTFIHRYSNEKTRVILMLKGDNFKCTLVVGYLNATYIPSENTEF